MIKLDSIPIPNPDAVGHIVDDQAVVVVPEHGSVKVFNEVGTRIWECIDGKLTIAEIIKLICDEFDIDLTTAEEDVLAFTNNILEMDIICLDSE